MNILVGGMCSIYAAIWHWYYVVVVVDLINVGFTEVVLVLLAFMRLYSIFNLQLFTSILFFFLF